MTREGNQVLPESVDEMLSKYRLCKGKAAHLDIEIMILVKRISDLKRNADVDEAISCVKYDGMPHGSGVSDTTGRVAVKFADGYKPQYIMENEADLLNLVHEKEAAQACIMFVEAWLAALDDRERYIIEKKDCDGMTWQNIADGFGKQFGLTYSREGVKRIHLKAKRKIYLMAS